MKLSSSMDVLCRVPNPRHHHMVNDALLSLLPIFFKALPPCPLLPSIPEDLAQVFQTLLTGRKEIRSKVIARNHSLPAS